jgi:hypothetical protein
MSNFLISLLPWPIFSSLSIHAGLVVLNLGSAFLLSVIESFALEAQFLVFVACHFSLVVLSHSSVFSER